MSFNLFATPTKDDIKVGYIDPTLGYVDGVSVCEANEYAKNNPGTTFIFRDGNNNLRYLNINEVNRLTPNDLSATTDECGGIQQYKECGPPRIQFFGGDGVGAAGNPVIGRDGSLLAVDLISGGYGYQYPPIVAPKDDCQIGNGAFLTAILGETVDEIEVFEGEEDFEEYELCENTDVGYGVRYGPNGEELGVWEPQTYTRVGADPIQREIEIFQKALKKPFWTTRETQPDRVFTAEESYATQDTIPVTFPEWGEFMNQYAVSPIKPSSSAGSDGAGRIFSMEWQLNFPISGEYIFRGVCDNTAQVYIDGGLVGNLKGFKDNPSPLQKTIQEGNHILKVDLLNVPIYETKLIKETQVAGSLFLNEGGQFYVLIGGNDDVAIAFTFDWDDNPSIGGLAVTNIKIATESGSPLVFSRSQNSAKGSVSLKGKFKANKKYLVTIEGSASGAKKPQIVDTGPNPDQKQQRINFFDADGTDVNAKLTAINAFQLSGARLVSSGEKIISTKSWNENPMGVSMIIDAPPPSIPQEQPPVQTGQCPPNPIWSTRFPGSNQKWYPVRFPSWSKFMNRYAISPILPLNTPGSDVSGSNFSNSWEIDLPYAGFYGVKGTRDNRGRILIDGKEVSSLDGFNVDNPKITKVYLSKGRHTIVAEVFNEPMETKTVIDTKIFSTQDWRSSLTETISTKVTKVKETQEWVQVDDVFIPPIKKTNFGQVEAGRGITGGTTIPNNAAFHRYNEGTYYEGKLIRSGGDWNNTNILTNYIQIDDETRVTLGSYHPENNERFGIAVWKKKKTQETQEIILPPQLSGPTKITKNGVTYEGPELFGYQNKFWSKFMNDYSVSPKVFTSIDSPDDRVVGKYTMTWRGVNFPQDGLYKFNLQGDSVASLKVGGVEILTISDSQGGKVQYTFNVTKGTYDVVLEVDNLGDPTYLKTIGANPYIFSGNPMGVALFISKDIVFTDTNKTPWTSNPVGISAILIPPPCAKKIGGRGVVDKVIVNDPGNGYLPPKEQGPGYPVTLVLDEVIVENSGINYSCGIDQLRIIPSNGAELSYDCDPFGKIRSVKVLNPGIGFNVYPEITLPSETGVNASFRPVFRVVRDPLLPPEQVDRIIQVTDLVGLKQTGYVDGRAYYGAVYYDEGLPFAGYYKTAGPQTRVYATLQESITARVTTPASAIQRSGTDIRSNDPRLNIPGTIEDTQT